MLSLLELLLLLLWSSGISVVKCGMTINIQKDGPRLVNYGTLIATRTWAANALLRTHWFLHEKNSDSVKSWSYDVTQVLLVSPASNEVREASSTALGQLRAAYNVLRRKDWLHRVVGKDPNPRLEASH